MCHVTYNYITHPSSIFNVDEASKIIRHCIFPSITGQMSPENKELILSTT